MFSSITIRINPFNIEYYFVLLELVETTFVFGSRMYVSGSITNRVGKYFFLASVPMFKGFMTEQKKTD